MLTLLLLLALDGRTYARVPLEKLKDWTRPRAEVCGPVVYVRKQQDRDIHVTLDNGKAKIVLEIIPSLPLPAPHKGQIVVARGIVRIDRGHGGWAELHPVEALRVVARCHQSVP